MVKDLICNMDVNPKTASFSSEYKGNNYYFCSKHCKMTFDKNPTEYVK